MADKSVYLLRCDNCYAVRAESLERQCQVCHGGTLRITNTEHDVSKIDRVRTQDLLKRLSLKKVTRQELMSEADLPLRVHSLVNDIKLELLSYLFYGKAKQLNFGSSMEEIIQSHVTKYITHHRHRLEEITEKVAFHNTEAVITYIQLKNLQLSPAAMVQDILPSLYQKLSLKETNDLMLCHHCSALYRSYNINYCIICGKPYISPIQRNCSLKEGDSVAEILWKLLLHEEENGFYQFHNLLLAFIITYCLKEKREEGFSFSLKKDIQKLQIIHGSLFQLYQAICQLLVNIGCELPPDVIDEPNRDGNYMSISSLGLVERSTEFYYKEFSQKKASISASVYSPVDVKKEETILIQIFIHEYGLADEAREFASAADGDSSKRTESLLDINSGNPHNLSVALVAQGLEVDDPIQYIKWKEGIQSVQFLATVPSSFRKNSAFCTVIISKDTIPIGQMKFKITVLSDSIENIPNNRKTTNLTTFQKYRRVFISYASEDRTEVLKRVQMLESLKIEFFQDVLSLEPGDKWEENLYRNIERSDAFFLFWSSAAAKSAWVKKEIFCVLNAKRGKEENPPYIIPILIEGPPPPAPPPELNFLHFNDKLLYFMVP